MTKIEQVKEEVKVHWEAAQVVWLEIANDPLMSHDARADRLAAIKSHYDDMGKLAAELTAAETAAAKAATSN
jgi:hypothetical protein